MRLYGQITKSEPQDDGTIKVYGVASSPALDAHGEVVTAEAMRAAIPDYLKFPAVREMHDATKAAGRAVEIAVEDDGSTSIVAHVVDPIAINKVKHGVYSGFSIGGRVKKRDTTDRTHITGLELVEVSLVDRPSCPEAVVSLWKSDEGDVEADQDLTVEDIEDEIAKRKFTAAERKKLAASGAAMADGSYPIQTKEDLRNAIQAFGRASNKAAVKRHIKARAKALGAEDELPDDWKTKADDGEGEGEALEKAAGEQSEVAKAADDAAAILASVMATLDKLEKREPVEEPRGMPPALVAGMDLRKGMYGLSNLGSLLQELAYAVFSADWESASEGDNSPVPAKLRTAFAALAEAYKAMSDEEIAELLASVNGESAAKAAVLALTDLHKADILPEHAEALTGAIKPLLAKGVALVEPVEATVTEEPAEIVKAAPDPELVERLAKAEAAAETVRAEVEAAKAEAEVAKADRDTLMKTVGGLTEGIRALQERVEKLAAEPLPPKTAGSLLAVEKTDDVRGASKKFTEEEVQRVLSALPEDERTLLLIKAARANSREVR